jgi:large repetitive protein
LKKVKCHITPRFQGKLFLRVFTLAFGVLFSGALKSQCNLNVGPDITICNGGQAMLGNSISLTGASGAITSYQWLIGATPVSSNSIALVSPAATITYTLTIAAPGCPPTSDDVQVTVLPGGCPTAQFTIPPGVFCAGEVVPINNTTVNQPGNTYFWNFGDGTTSTSSNPGSHNFNVPVGTGISNFTITLIVTNAAGQSDIFQSNVSIQQIPSPPEISSTSLITFNGQEYLRKCTSTPTSNIAVTDNTPANVNAWANNFTLDWGDGSPVISSATEPVGPQIHNYNQGTYTLTYSISNSNGCSVVNTYEVFIGNTPSIGLNGQQVDTCAAYTASYQISNVQNNVAGTYYEVTYNDGSPLVTFNHPPPASFTHTFTTTSCGNSSPNYSDAYFCTIKAINPCGEGQATIEPIRISTPPVASFTINPNPACVNSDVSIQNTADPGEVVTINGCTADYKVIWEITPAAGWTLSGGAFGSDNGGNYSVWTSGSDLISVNFNTPGNYQITQRIGNSFCGIDEITQTVCIVPPVAASFNTSSNGTCAPVIVSTDNLTENVPACAAPVYAWSITPSGGFQTGNSSSFEPSFLLTTDGIYTITLSATNACGTNTDDAQFVVVSPPSIAITTVAAGCAPYAVDPEAIFDAGGGILGTPIWTFENASSAGFNGLDPDEIVFSTPGSQDITVEVSNECATTSSSISVIISDAPQISVPDFSTCSGSTFTINNGNPVLAGGSGTAPYTYDWSGAGGSSSISNPDFTLSNPGNSPQTQILNLTATDDIGCASSASINVEVLPLPSLDFQTSVPGNEMCFGTDSIALSMDSDVSGTTYIWDPPLGTSATTGNQINVSPPTTTNYTVTGSNPNTGCSSSIPFTITVYPLPNVDAGDDIILCSQGITAVFLDQTPPGGIWNDPTPLTGTLNPDETYLPGISGSRDTLIYTFIDGNGCLDSDWLAIEIIEPSPPDAGVDTSFCLNALPYLLDAANPGGGVWTGPGVAYSFTDTSFVPSDAGVGIHELIYTMNVGSTCETHDTIVVEVFELPNLSIPLATEVCSGDSISFSASANGGAYPYEWAWFPALWATGGTNDSTITMVPINPGPLVLYAPISVVITDSNNCVVSEWFELTVNALPAITAGLDTSICFSPGTPYELNGFSPITGNISWSEAPSNQGSLNGLDYTSGGLGIDSLFFTFTDTDGCTSVDTLEIQVTSPITIDAGLGFLRCENDAASLLPTPLPSSPPAQFTAYWTGPGVEQVGSDYFFNPGVSGPGTFILNYVFETGATCAASDTILVTVGPAPIVNAGLNIAICAGDTLSLSGSVNGGTAPFTYSWTPSTNLSATDILNPEFYSVDAGSTIPLIQTFTLTVTDSFNCQVSNDVDITINPIPQVIAPDYTFCSQEIVELLNTASPSGGIWTSSDISIVGANSFTPTVNGVFSATYSYTDANGCFSSDEATITVVSPAIVSIGPDIELCQFDDTLQFISNYVDVPAIWSGAANSDGEFFAASAGNFTVIFTTGEGSCVVSDTTQIVVNSLPAADAGPNINVCDYDSPLQLTGQSPVTGGTGVWSGIGISGDSFNPAGLPIDSYWAFYQFTNDVTGCQAIDSLEITIRTASELSFANSQLEFCLTNFQNNLNLSGAAPSGGVWSGAGVTELGGNYFFEAQTLGATNLTYTYTNSFGCVSDSAITANVIEPVYATIDTQGPVELCFNPDSVYALAGSPAGGSWVYPSWINPDGTFTASNADTTIAVYSIGTQGCQTYDTIAVTVFALPITNAGLDRNECINQSCVQLQNFIPAGPGGSPVTGAFWSGEANISLSGQFCPNLSPPGENLLYYNYTDPQTGCSSKDSIIFNVHPLPEALVDLPAAYCHDAQSILQNASIGDTIYGGPLTWMWTIIDSNQDEVFTSDLQNPTYVFDETSDYQIQLEVTTETGCSDLGSFNIESVDPPTAQFSLSADSVCAPATISIINSSIGFEIQHSWSITGVYSSTQALPQAILLPPPVINDTTFMLNVQVTNLCGTSELELPIFAKVPPTPYFEVDNPASCSPFIPEFTNLSYGQVQSFAWNLGDGTALTNENPVNHAFYALNNDTTQYIVQLFVENECRVDTMSIVITALPNTVTSFFNTDPPWGCAPLTVDFTNVSGGSTEYLWDFGDGSPLQSSEDASHTYLEGGIYLISLVSNDECSIDTSYAEVNVFATPEVNFTLDEEVFCLGDALSINNLSQGAVAYSWAFGNGENGVGFEPLYEYPEPGNYQIRLIGFSPVFACPDTTYGNVTVQALPLIDINPEPVAGCIPLNVVFTNNTQFSTSSAWDFGNGTSSNLFSPTATYYEEGTFLAKLTAQNYNFASNLSCTAFEEIPITVFPKPESGFNSATDYDCGPPASTTVENTSTGAFAYLWSWENQQSIQFEPNIFFAEVGMKSITLVASNEFSCSDTTISQFEVIGQPDASLRIDPPNGCAPLDVAFESLSTYGDSWIWDFGDGSATSTSQITNHNFANPGYYTVSLSVSNDNLCMADTVITSAIVVHPNATANFLMNPDLVSTSDPVVTFTNQSLNANDFIIETGDGASYPSFISQHLYEITNESNFIVTLIANNDFNCPDTLSQELKVAPSPTIYIANSFTPNGDGKNDSFGPAILVPPIIYNFTIYDRWGHLVFETLDIEEKWDGTMFNNGIKPIKQDVYVYKIILSFAPEKVEQLHGNVTVIY